MSCSRSLAAILRSVLMEGSSLRVYQHVETFSASMEELFKILHTPSAICAWWFAKSAIVLAQPGGFWTAVWGSDGDDPDYITSATISIFDPPRRLVLTEFRYWAKSGQLPFEANFTTEFNVRQTAAGIALEVTQSGFPDAPIGDNYFAACQRGWKDTFAGIRAYLIASATS